jgi:hypothetical protein
VTSPTARTMGALRADGYHAEVVEKWIPGVNRRCDFLGCFDLLALKPGQPLLGIQTTSGTNHASRVKKLRGSPLLPLWLACGHAAEVWSWFQHNGRWQVRKEALQVQDAVVETTMLTSSRRPRRQRRGERQGGLFADGNAEEHGEPVDPLAR